MYFNIVYIYIFTFALSACNADLIFISFQLWTIVRTIASNQVHLAVHKCLHLYHILGVRPVFSRVWVRPWTILRAIQCLGYESLGELPWWSNVLNQYLHRHSFLFMSQWRNFSHKTCWLTKNARPCLLVLHQRWIKFHFINVWLMILWHAC